MLFAAALFAAFIVSFLSLDLGRIDVGGRSLRSLAETQGSRFLRRPLHIGQIRALMWPGEYELRDVVIEGRSPGDRPFVRAGSIIVRIEWTALLRREILLNVTMRDWAMSVERWGDGTHSIPRLRPDPSSGGPRSYRTTMQFVRATGGEFWYEDHGVPWRVVAPNLTFDLVRTASIQAYVGTARFKGGAVTIQNYRPMDTALETRFTLDGSRVTLHHIDLETEGARSHVTGELDFSRFHEQTYYINSTLDFARMHEIFFADSAWDVAGSGRFRGVFQLYQDGRNLSGEFASDLAHLQAGGEAYQFPNLHGTLQWLPDRFVVPHAEADLEGGRAAFSYGLAPLGRPGGSTAKFSADYSGVDLERITSRFDLAGLGVAGRAAGHIEMQWPNGRFGSMTGHGDTVVTPPDGVVLAPRVLPAALPPAAAGELPPPADPAGTRPAFDPDAPIGTLQAGGDLKYQFEAGRLVIGPSWAATGSTRVDFQGRTDYGAGSEIPFHVTSLDWQESDRVLAAMMTAFGRRTGAVEVGGRGEFTGVMTESFTAPRIEGVFTAEAMRAWDVTWGPARGDLVIQNGYLDITKGVIGDSSGASILADGRFALGYPRADGGEEIRAHVVVNNWPMRDLRHAFDLDDWPMEGTVGLADLRLEGPYRGMFGLGALRIDQGSAWGESFTRATGALSFEGTGLRITGIEMPKGTGLVRGAAWVGWDGRYAFDADGERVPVESLDTFRFETAPLSGQLQFKASGAGAFDSPRYEFDGTIADLAAGDEGIGAVRGRLTVENQVLSLDLGATSNRLDIAGTGTIAQNDTSDSEMRFRFFETSVDPYLKFFAPEVSPYTRIIASGTLHIAGPLADPARMLVETTVETASVTLLDYELTNDGPVELRFADNAFAVRRMRLHGVETTLDVTGGLDVGRERADIAANGQANLAILQLFFGDLGSSGAARIDARLQGGFDSLALSGQATIANGSIRHFSLPHSLSAINGPIRFDAAGIDISRLRGRMGNGDVAFGGRVTLRDGYRPDEFNVTASGRSMRLRYPEGFTSTVNADLELQGPVGAPTLSGTVDVLSVDYRPAFDQNAGLFGLARGAVGGTPGGSLPGVVTEMFPLAFDIRVIVPTMRLIDNATATINGSAGLEFTGTLNQPVLTGRIDIDSGEVSFLGNRYLLQPSTIDFTEAAPFEPVFDIQAETRARAGVQTFNLTLRLTGTFAQLTPELTSDPYLPPTDVVTLIFGGVPAVGSVEQRQLTPTESQQIMVQTAGAALLTSPISSRVESVLRNNLGIDTVQITPQLYSLDDLQQQQLNPAARLVLGQRISENVFLTYSRVLQANEQEIIRLEYEQSARVSWVLSRNENRTFSLDFRIRYVFR